MQLESPGTFSKIVGEVAAITPAATAPAWVPVLTQINVILTTVSLILGMALAVWRAWVWWKRGAP